ncbi:hypothetical protein SFUMM280S_09519 [Streptomyces fumanus]
MKLQRKNRRALALGALAVSGALALTACGSDDTGSETSGGGASATTQAGDIKCDDASGQLQASGFSAQKNAIDAWVKQFAAACKGVQINYNPTGSGAGVTAFTQGQTAFAGSDSALKPEEITASKKVCSGGQGIDLPMVGGPIAVGFNVPGVELLLGGSPARCCATLPKRFAWAVAAGAVLLGLGISFAAGLDSSIQWALIAAVLFVAGSYGISAKVEGPRQAKDRVATSLVWVAFLMAIVPLASLAWDHRQAGIKVFDGYFLTHSMGVVADTEPGGGIYHAILGTAEQVGLATLISVPIGVLTAIYLVEYGRGRLAQAVTFFVDVMTGIPSIVAGLFILSLWILILDMGYSGFAGSMALTILMIPVVVRSTEEMLKLVPNELREASLALGVPKWRTILKVVLPTSIGGITTGIMLAVARIAGETAPVLLLVWGANFINANPFKDPQASLPMYIYLQFTNSGGQGAAYDRAWAAALTLIAFIMILNLVARGIARWKAPKTGR